MLTSVAQFHRQQLTLISPQYHLVPRNHKPHIPRWKVPINHSTSPDKSHRDITHPSQPQHEAATEPLSHPTHSKQRPKKHQPGTGQLI